MTKNFSEYFSQSEFSDYNAPRKHFLAFCASIGLEADESIRDSEGKLYDMMHKASYWLELLRKAYRLDVDYQINEEYEPSVLQNLIDECLEEKKYSNRCHKDTDFRDVA
jgi:hypothetical protein